MMRAMPCKIGRNNPTIPSPSSAKPLMIRNSRQICFVLVEFRFSPLMQLVASWAVLLYNESGSSWAFTSDAAVLVSGRVYGSCAK